jgi:hypothetical protein
MGENVINKFERFRIDVRNVRMKCSTFDVSIFVASVDSGYATSQDRTQTVEF